LNLEFTSNGNRTFVVAAIAAFSLSTGSSISAVALPTEIIEIS